MFETNSRVWQNHVVSYYWCGHRIWPSRLIFIFNTKFNSFEACVNETLEIWKIGINLYFYSTAKTGCNNTMAEPWMMIEGWVDHTFSLLRHLTIFTKNYIICCFEFNCVLQTRQRWDKKVCSAIFAQNLFECYHRLRTGICLETAAS